MDTERRDDAVDSSDPGGYEPPAVVALGRIDTRTLQVTIPEPP